MKDVYKKPGDRWLEETVKYLDKLTEVLLRAYRKWEEEQEREKK